jgi:hypothetical protein
VNKVRSAIDCGDIADRTSTTVGQAPASLSDLQPNPARSNMRCRVVHQKVISASALETALQTRAQLPAPIYSRSGTLLFRFFHNRPPLFRTVRKYLQEKALVAFLHDLDLDGFLRHCRRTWGLEAGSGKTEAEGQADQVKGKAQNAVGGAKDKAREVLNGE